MLRPIYSRMPVILDEAGGADWMNLREPDPLSLKRLLAPAPDDLLVVRPASPLVNSVKNEVRNFWKICRYLANSRSEQPESSSSWSTTAATPMVRALERWRAQIQEIPHTKPPL
jgi:hypothetical protein